FYSSDPKCGQKFQEPKPWSYLNLFTRIVGGNQVKQGSHPWQVSLKRRQKHFCGGTIVSAQWVVTAAHCILDRNLLKYLNVTAGEHDLRIRENGEQTLPVKYVIKHPNFDPRRPMNYDIALLKLDGAFIFSPSVLPACLPDPGEKFEAGYICTACGWGRLNENGVLPQVLYEVNLPILNSKECSRALSTLKNPIQGDTIMCAGFPDGGKDACQGDSGGPLLCRRKHGAWTLAGVISWGMGCARGWISNEKKKHYNRGSPGIFTDLSVVLPWIQEKMSAGIVLTVTSLCSIQDGKLSGSEGELDFPGSPQEFYQNHQLCVWTLFVPEGNYIWLNFSRFDIEPETFCDYDYLSVYSKDNRLVGKFCGRDLPLPILIGSNNVRLKFVSDSKDYGTGFSMTYKALSPGILPGKYSGCASLAVIFEEGVLQSMHYPEHYNNMANCQWIICAPEDHVIKLTYQSFEIEDSEDCSYDAVTVYEDVGKEEEIAKSCGFALPAPVLSSSAMMLVAFHSDETETFGGFRATVSFVHVTGNKNSSSAEEFKDVDMTEDKIQVITNDSCGMPSNQPRFIFSRIIGGEEAVPYSWPWQVSVQISDEHICGGAVLAKEWVVTAAHCFNSKEPYRDLWMVVTGLHDLTEQEYRQRRSIKQYIIHPSFNKTSMDSDIALLQLAEPLEFNHYVRPVCLPAEEEAVQPSRVCVVTGWGADEEDREKGKKLHQLEVPILVPDTCQSYYINLPSKVTQRMICAGFPLEDGKDSCTGDSGGPLVCASEDNLGFYTLHGITSWGLGCGKKSYPGVYTNISAFVDWIKQSVNSSGMYERKK
ncbi:OVCH2 protein, partial [Indicator maculatus]|nr:OVCH2 protein [Indicator maculatus]